MDTTLSDMHRVASSIKRVALLSRKVSSARNNANRLKRDASKSARVAHDMQGTTWAAESSCLALIASQKATTARAKANKLSRECAWEKRYLKSALKKLTKDQKKTIRRNLRYQKEDVIRADQKYIASIKRIREQVIAERLDHLQ